MTIRRVDSQKEHSWLLDPKQIFFALLGGVLGVGLLFLTGTRVYEALNVEVATGPLSIASTASLPVQGKRVEERTEYSFFSLLDDSAPRRDIYELKLPENPALKEKRARKAKLRKQRKEREKRRGKKGSKKSKSSSKKSGAKKERRFRKRTVAVHSSAKQVQAPKQDKRSSQVQVAKHVVSKGNAAPLALLNASFGTSKAVPLAKPKQKYTVQVGSFRAQNEAKVLFQKLKKSGHRPRLRTVNVPGRGQWFEVSVGHFVGKEEAKRFKGKLRKKEGLKGFVKSL